MVGAFEQRARDLKLAGLERFDGDGGALASTRERLDQAARVRSHPHLSGR
jgi:hypothetical protein